MPECTNCGNRQEFTKKQVTAFDVVFDPDHGEIEHESDEYDWGHAIETSCPHCGDDVSVEMQLVCAHCGSTDITRDD